MSEAKYSEELIGILLQAALTVSGRNLGSFIISPVISRRQEEGWDAQVDLNIYPFYMQFKKPCSHSGKESLLVRQRKALGAKTGTPLRFFYLRRQAKTKEVNQHNALFALSRNYKAAYVCPLFMEQSVYQASIQNTIATALQSWVSGTIFDFWEPDTVLIRTERRRRARFEDIPIFRNHVSIPPTGTIEEPEKHRYSFTDQGGDICFHSPERIESGGLLGQWLQDIYEASDGQSFSCKNGDKLREIVSLLQEYNFDFSIPPQVTIDTWSEFGDMLEDAFGISQFAVLRAPRQ